MSGDYRWPLALVMGMIEPHIPRLSYALEVIEFQEASRQLPLT